MNDNMTTATHMFDHSKKLAEAYEKVMQPLCKKLDMPKTALDVLMFLANNPEFNTAGDVCRYRNIKAALVSFHVEKLVEAGFVERQAVKGDRRKGSACYKRGQRAAEKVCTKAYRWLF